MLSCSYGALTVFYERLCFKVLLRIKRQQYQHRNKVVKHETNNIRTSDDRLSKL